MQLLLPMNRARAAFAGPGFTDAAFRENSMRTAEKFFAHKNKIVCAKKKNYLRSEFFCPSLSANPVG